jgi:hypothetical protein
LVIRGLPKQTSAARAAIVSAVIDGWSAMPHLLRVALL